MEEKLGVIRGTMRKREWLTSGDIVLVGIRNFQKRKSGHNYMRVY